MGAALRLVFRATLRQGWAGILGIAVLVGVAGGVVLTGAEAYRRTTTAFDRMRDSTEAWDVLVNPDAGIESELTVESVAALPEVAQVGRVDGGFLGLAHLDGLDRLDDEPTALASDGHVGYDFARFQVQDGRLPDRDADDEILLTPLAAEGLGLDVGDTYEGRFLSFEDFGEVLGQPSAAAALERYNDADLGQRADLAVVGIGVPLDELVVDEDFLSGAIFLPPGVWERYDEPTGGYFGLPVRLAPGTSVDELREAVEGLVPRETIAMQSADSIAGQVERAVTPDADAVRLFTVIAGLVAVVIVGQAISRRLQLDAVADPALRALGLTRPQRVVLGLGRMAAAGVLGGVLAIGIAVAASPIGPIGAIRPAEPDPGLRVDLPVLVLGGLGVALVTVAVSIWPAVRSSRSTVAARREAGLVTSRLVGWGARPAAVMGARFALEPGPGGVPTRSTLVGATTGVVLVAAAVTFAACLDHFVDSPDLYGTSWSQMINVDTTSDDVDVDYGPVGEQLAADERVEAYALVHPGQLELDGRSVPALALAESRRPLPLTVVEGRTPEGDDEVVLGSSTLDELELEVGDTVAVTGPDGDEGELAVVGRGVLPVVASYSGANKTTLAEGAAMTAGGLAAWSPEFSPAGIAARFAPGADAEDVVADLRVAPLEFVDVKDAGRPSDVTSLERVRTTPLLLTALVVGLLALTVIHALAAAVRARRRELAVLRTFGFSRPQVVGTVATQAALIALIGLVVGLPLGVAAGRWAWTRVADGRGALVSLVTPSLVLAVTAAVVLAVALASGLVPGVRAARAHPAAILRTE
jgi:hypothetical protein